MFSGRVRVLRAEVAALAESHEEILVYARAWKRSAEYQQELRLEIEEIVEERDSLSEQVAELTTENSRLEWEYYLQWERTAEYQQELRRELEKVVAERDALSREVDRLLKEYQPALPKQDSDSYW